jgi:transposase
MQAVIGVDPHKYVLTAVALDGRGGVLGRWSGGASGQGFRALRALRAWGTERAPGAVWAIEGSNRLGRRLAVLLAADGIDVRDVCPTRTADRRRRRPGQGKSDAVDAEAIARELLAHPELPRAFTAAAGGPPDPLREELTLLVRARRQLVDRHRQVLNEAEPLLGELPAALTERLPAGKPVHPRLAAAARRRRTGEPLTDLRLSLLRAQAREERALAAAGAALERRIGAVVRRLETSLPGLCGLGPLGAAELLAEVGDPRRFPSADAFAAYTGTAPIPASSAEARGHPVHHRLSRSPAESVREPPPQRRALPHGPRAPARPPRDAGLHRPPAGRRQDPARRPAHRQAAAGPPRLADHDGRPAPGRRSDDRRLQRTWARPRDGRAGRRGPGAHWHGLVRGRTSYTCRRGGGASPAGAERSGAAERGEA